MSTRSTVIRDEESGWHIYGELLDENNLYLSIDSFPFAFDGPIPDAIAKVIMAGLKEQNEKGSD